MNVLFLSFLAGTAAVAFPIVFHLIRRTPKGRQEFSSLMFLQPTPPRLTRRSRLDDWLLLLLRTAVIVLLALAFTRPFWQTAVELSADDVRGRHVAILVDTSASMQRGKLWPKAIAEAEKVLEELEPADVVALWTFDRTPERIVGFPDEQAKDAAKLNHELVRGELAKLEPSWRTTRLGDALVTVAEQLTEIEDKDDEPSAPQIVLISDLQEGADWQTLQAFEWPEQVQVDVRSLTLPTPSNASLQLLTRTDSDEPNAPPKVRVHNSSDSTTEQFRVRWASADSLADGQTVKFYVPPGESRVLSVPRDQSTNADRLVLTGDHAEFDNTFFVVPPKQQHVRVAYLGDDASDDPQGLLYYFESALAETPQRRVEITKVDANDPLLISKNAADFVLVTAKITDAEQAALERYFNDGGTALVVLQDSEVVSSFGPLLSEVVTESETPTVTEDDYQLLGEIDFSHPLFRPFANPRYSDFTAIRFWQTVPIDLPTESSATVIARFDNYRPALWEQTVGEGRLFVLTSGWQPSHSQFALSTKFVPWLEALLSLSVEPTSLQTSPSDNQTLTLPENPNNETRFVETPGGEQLRVPKDATEIETATAPGIYQLVSESGRQTFAVNVPHTESQTAPFDLEQLEQLGVSIGVQTTREEEYARLSRLQNIELENRQKLWKWCIVAALVLIGLETGLAAWRTRRTHSPKTDQPE
ncbi:BatA domain-containing protein [Thalassoroseus pseudoceratinae]|uniref:BatA domain-containing protein n=1 Tax=Thalassoroseus pseudoceratinae TaxID=2713176 RepID=UPI00141E2FC2|nr:BatA domain-containing protein [Thalassoroseus pseudoceratinae]